MTILSPASVGRRVLIVDDSAAYRQILTRALDRIQGLTVLGAVGTLALARSRIERGDVDAVTLDIVLRGESGLDLLQWLRRRHPTVLVVLVSGEASGAGVEALLLGAALVAKPSGPDAEQQLRSALERELTGGLRHGARQRSTHTIRSNPGLATPLGRSLAGAARRELIAIGASTGGPPVLLKLLQSLSPAFEVPLVIVQHMSAAHVGYFVELLAQQSGRNVQLAKHGALIERRTTYVAGDAKHLRIARQGGRLVMQQDDGPAEHHCKPAVDPLFRSVAAACGAAVVGVVTTGMGTDGALGALALRTAGAPVVVQDAASSVVWGMPGAAVAAHAVDAIVPGFALASTIDAWTTGWKSFDEESRS